MTTVYLSLGSNLGSRDSNLKRAIQLLHGPELRVLCISPVYETAPVDMPDQPLFLNIVVQAETALDPGELLARTQAVEQALGRKPAAPKGFERKKGAWALMAVAAAVRDTGAYPLDALRDAAGNGGADAVEAGLALG